MGKIGVLTDVVKSGLTKAEEVAETILDFLRKGEPEKITEEMLEEADDVYLYKNYDLPMDEASRMKRAEEMGFDVNNVSYHGTKVASLDKFDPKFMKQGLGGKVLYSTDIPKIASGYAGGDMPYDISSGSGVLPLLLRGKRKAMSAADLAKGKNKYFENVRKNIQTAKDEGFAGMDLQTTDPTGAKVQTTFDLSNVRSKFARFDPRLRYLKNLLASAAPVAVSLGALSELKEEPQ